MALSISRSTLEALFIIIHQIRRSNLDRSITCTEATKRPKFLLAACRKEQTLAKLHSLPCSHTFPFPPPAFPSLPILRANVSGRGRTRDHWLARAREGRGCSEIVALSPGHSEMAWKSQDGASRSEQIDCGFFEAAWHN